MLLSAILYPSLKEIPKDATVTSHILMLRAGLIRKLSSGLYSYLPLGRRSFRKVEQIIREEMDKAGAQEFSLPILTPAELWEKSGRWKMFGPELMRVQDRHQTAFALGPTHEEVFTHIAKNELSSYKQLPVTFYQIKTKFRDEVRPRFGVMRSREFTMKDAYSFDLNSESLDKTYEIMKKTYEKIFRRLGLKTTIVSADSGTMGGNTSEEFMVESDVGEDLLVICSECGYASNMEKASSGNQWEKSQEKERPLEKISTPEIKTIRELTEFLKTDARHFIKTLIYLYGKEPVAVLIRGDLEVNEAKLSKVLGPETLELADDSVINKTTKAPSGFAGPIGLTDIKILADQSLSSINNGFTGANEKNFHYQNVNMPRDFAYQTLYDLSCVREKDPCPQCGKELQIRKGIEVGHIFKLGKKYTDALGVRVQNQDGKDDTPTMGCYGIGVDRTLAAIIEQSHDQWGIRFPVSCAPFAVIITPVDFSEPEQKKTARDLYHQLKEKGIEVLMDDRNLRPGFKFKDADLLGIPLRITVGPRFLKENKVEIKLRNETESSTIEISRAVQKTEKILLDLQGDNSVS